MTTRKVGHSLKRHQLADYAAVQEHYGFVEFVPENWHPDDPEANAFLQSINPHTRLLPHCLSLNLLADGPSPAIRERVATWIDRLALPWISDHFSWSGAGEIATGVFIPPLGDFELFKGYLQRNLSMFSVPMVLENISCGYGEAPSVMAYHRFFLSCATSLNFAIILDVENIRLDAANAGMDPAMILALYEAADVTIKYFHIAGGTQIDDLFLDTHDQPCSDETLALLAPLYVAHPAPVIYERDYAIDFAQTSAEIARLDAYLQKVLEKDTSTRNKLFPASSLKYSVTTPEYSKGCEDEKS